MVNIGLYQEALHDRYLPDNEAAYHPAVAVLLEEKGFQVELTNESITKVTWANQEADFSLLHWFLTELRQTTLNPEVNLSTQLATIIDQLDARMSFDELSQTPSYQQLNDTQIEVTSAHQGNTPYQHIKNVLAKLRLDEYVKRFDSSEDRLQFIIQMVIDVFLHDWGKITIANHDEFQFHAEISYLLSREWLLWLAEHGILEELFLNQTVLNQEQALQPVRFHHFFELIDRGLLQPEEIRALVPDSLAFAALTLLAAADTESIFKYRKYTFGSLVDALRSLTSTELAEPEVVFLLKQLAGWLHHVLISGYEAEPDNAEYFERKSALLREWVAGLPEPLAELFAQVMPLLFQPISI